MAYKETVHGDGSTRSFVVPFPFLSREHVAVSVADVPFAPHRYTWLSNTMIEMDQAPDVGAEIRIERKTPANLTTKFSGNVASLSGASLDAANLQLLFLLEEREDGLKGPQGDTGLPENTYTTLETFKASDWTILRASLRLEGLDGDFVFKAGDFTGQADDRHVIKANTVPLSAGAWVRQGADSLTFVQAGSNSIRRPLGLKAAETVSALDKGAKGDGIANDTAAIVAADATAALFGKDLFLPAGTYMIDAITATTSWYGEPGTILKHRKSPSTFVAMVTASVDNIVFEGITFDGNCSNDPVAWNNANMDAFTGAAGLSVESCKRPSVINCRAQNMRQHGFRFYNCNGAVWRGCTSRRLRGNFGDGFIAISCVNLSVSDCYAEDYTRIGFVVDSFGNDIITCHKIAFSRCFARNGHDASYIYGGGEFNAGFWFEHTGDVSMDACFAFDNVHRGINICTGSKTNDFPGSRAMISISNCHTVGGRWGILTYSLVDLPISSKVVNCSSKLAGTAFEGSANVVGDTYTWLGCHADYDASSGAQWGFSCQVGTQGGAIKPSFFVGPGCTVSRWKETLANLIDSGDNAATADIGGYFTPSVGIRLTVDGVRHSNGGPIYVRWYESAGKAHEFFASNTELYVSRGASDGGHTRVHNCVVRALLAHYGNAAIAELKNCTVLGHAWLSATRVDLNGNTVSIADASHVWLLSASSNGFPGVFVNGTRFEKPINSGYVLRLGFGAISFNSILTACVFVNTGPADSSHAFIGYAAGAARAFNGCFADNSVTNITMLDSGGGAENVVTGVQKIAMH